MGAGAQALRTRRWLSRLLWAAVLGLAVRVIAGVSMPALGAKLRGIDPARIAAIVAVDLALVAAAPLRLWLLSRGRAAGAGLPYPPLIVYRMASSAVNYLTPGAQVGGEPLQALLLSRRHGMATAEAAGLTVLARLVEVAGNLAFLGLGLFLIAAGGGAHDASASAPLAVPLAAALALLAAPFAYGLALRSGRRPAAAAAARLASCVARAGRFYRLARFAAGVRDTEEALAAVCLERPAAIAQALAASALLWVPVVLEYRLLLAALGLHLGLRSSIEALALARAALLAPIPGAIAVLEAAQVVALRRLGESTAAGLSLGLLIRARDLAFVLPGLAVARFLRRGRSRDPVRR